MVSLFTVCLFASCAFAHCVFASLTAWGCLRSQSSHAVRRRAHQPATRANKQTNNHNGDVLGRLGAPPPPTPQPTLRCFGRAENRRISLGVEATGPACGRRRAALAVVACARPAGLAKPVLRVPLSSAWLFRFQPAELGSAPTRSPQTPTKSHRRVRPAPTCHRPTTSPHRTAPQRRFAPTPVRR
jgi:hypothetical protein